jgi:hypothetical protein
MVDHVNLALYLICHHGWPDDALKDARVIQRISIEKRIPITYFFSGIELNALNENRDRINHELWMDLVGAIQSDLFINPRFGNNNPYKPELGIMSFHHIPLVQPWSQDLWGEYFKGFLENEIKWSQALAEQKFHKTPVTTHPPDGVYAPAAAYTLRGLGLDTVVVSGEFLDGNAHAKGVLYWASGLRHLMRTNDIQPQSPEFSNAGHFVDAVEDYGHQNDIGFVTVGCDIDEFNGMNEKKDGGMNLHDGIARLCCIGDEVYRRPGVSMVNCNAAAYWNLHQTSIENVWQWNDVHGMIHGNGDLGWIDSERNGLIGYLIWLTGERYRQGWDVRQAKDRIQLASDIALRNEHFCYGGWMTNYFYENVNAARGLLQG